MLRTCSLVPYQFRILFKSDFPNKSLLSQVKSIFSPLCKFSLAHSLLHETSIGKQLNTTLKYLSEKYKINYTIDFEKAIVSANSVLLLSLLYNLADNAFKASYPQTSIKIYSKTIPTAVQIYVEDRGRGIAKENIRLLTEPFYREDKSRSRKLGGAGLGLALCKEIAIIHGTELDFESEKDKGTTVSFSLCKGDDE